MDPLTHAVAGLAQAWIEPTLLNLPADSANAEAIFWTSLLASQVVDGDIVIRLTGALNYFRFHRVITHNVLAIPLLSLLTAFVIKLFFKANIWLLFFTALTGICIHVALDLLTVYGTMPFWPFSNKVFAWDILMVMDPVLLLTPLASKLLSLLIISGKTAAISAITIILIYLLLRLIIHQRLKTCLLRDYPTADRVAVLPNYLGLVKWKFVVKQGTKNFSGNMLFPTCKITDIKYQTCSCDVSENLLEKAKNTPVAKAFLQFATFPLLRYRKLERSHFFQWTELRYQFKGYEFFKANILLNNEGDVIQQSLGDMKGRK